MSPRRPIWPGLHRRSTGSGSDSGGRPPGGPRFGQPGRPTREWSGRLAQTRRQRSSGLRPARTRSTICRRNSGEYGGRVLGIGSTSDERLQGVHQTGSIPPRIYGLARSIRLSMRCFFRWLHDHGRCASTDAARAAERTTRLSSSFLGEWCGQRIPRNHTRLRSPPQRQQHRGKQQECAECQLHPSLGQAAGKRDSSGDRGHSTKRKR